jgi:hypothetical protein
LGEKFTQTLFFELKNIIFSMLLKMEHRSSLEAGREMFYNVECVVSGGFKTTKLSKRTKVNE